MLRISLILFLCIFGFSNNASAMNLIRDAEIEKTLRDYSTPIFLAAGLSPESINIYIINDKSINAFVAGGQNMFINTGLIMQSDTANMTIGVIAHEAGHISGGHIVKRYAALEGLSLQTILSTVLGAAVTVAGLPEAGVAILAGGQHVAGRDFLQYNREQEVAADQAGLNYLEKTNQSSQGLLQMMQILRRQQTLNFDKIDQYAISHPLSQDRVSHIRSRTAAEKDVPYDNFTEQHARMVAKLDGFIEKPAYVFDKYKGDSVPSLYAKSIAYFRMSDLENALKNLDKLIEQSPEDPFFNELKGQMLFENGKVHEAIPYYQKAVLAYPRSALLNQDLGRVYLRDKNQDEAIKYLTKAANLDPRGNSVWRLLATAYGEKGNKGMLNLMLAEEANILGKSDEAKNYADTAKKILIKDSSGWLRANDIINEIKYDKKRDNG